MHRKTGVLEIIALYLEPDIKPGRRLESGLTTAIEDFARWQGARQVVCKRLPDGLFTHTQGEWEIAAVD